MADVHDIKTRSYNMSQIRSKNTKPEMIVRKFLFSKGFRYRLHDKKFPGKPDIVLAKHQTLIFIHGCFWHGHKNCKDFVVPKTRTEWWLTKIDKNITKDKLNKKQIMKYSLNVIIIWECQLKSDQREKTLNKLVETLTSRLS